MGLRFGGAARRGRSKKKWQRANENNIKVGSAPSLCVFCGYELLPQKQRWWRLGGILEGFLSSTPNLGISGPIDSRPPSHWAGFQITGSKLFEIRLACFQRTHLIESRFAALQLFSNGFKDKKAFRLHTRAPLELGL